MYLPTDYERQLNVWIDEVYYGHYYEYEDYNIKYLGTYESGTEVHLGLTLVKDDCYIKDFLFYYCDSDRLDDAFQKIQDTNSETVINRRSGDDLEISVHADEDCVLFTTIPAQEGWTVYVGGIRVEYETALEDSLIAIPVTQGKHEIVMKFFPAGLKWGLILTIIGIGMIVMVLLMVKWLNRPVKIRENENTMNDAEPTEFLKEFDIDIEDRNSDE